MGKYKNTKLFILSGFLIILIGLSVFSLHSEQSLNVFENVVLSDTVCIDDFKQTVSTFNDKDVSQLKLIPGGFPFGVKFYTKGVVVVGISDVETEKGFVSPAGNAGFKKGDIITEIDSVPVNTIDEISQAIQNSNGQNIVFTLMRESESLQLTLTPVKSQHDKSYKSGMWIRDSTAGIGTVTFIDPETLQFGGLGHGICDSDTGSLMPLSHGSVVNVEINSIVRGIGGRPGELKGEFESEKIGSLTLNSSQGVFGVFDSLPAKTCLEPFAVAKKSEVTQGSAKIYSSIQTGKNNIYDIEITKINSDSSDTKNFIIKVTDPRLIELTGGIIQGMSGSPIVQNGKLIGAVTHVLVNDPTKGYGIFIENMLSAS